MHIKQQLYALINNIDALESIFDNASQFNMFSAAGLAEQELKHSHFLSFLLNPNASHGLGSTFLKRFLTKVMLNNHSVHADITATDIVCADWDEVDVYRERDHIDICIDNKKEKIVIILENKVNAFEHGNQLVRYVTWCESNYTTYSKKLFILLSPSSMQPSHPLYLTAAYEDICNILEQICAAYKSRLSDDVQIAIKHYLDLVRSRILQNDPIRKQAEDLYRRYQAAFDYIYEVKPDNDGNICQLMKEVAANTSNLEYVWGKRKLLQYVPKAWESIDVLNQGTSWDGYNQLMMIELKYEDKSVYVDLYLGNGPEDARNKIYEHVRQVSLENFIIPARLNKKYTRLYRKEVLQEQTVKLCDLQLMRDELNAKWQEFVKGDLQKMTEDVVKLFST